MPTALLTEVTIRAVRAASAGEQIDYWDTRTPGFGLRVGSRTKTFVVKRANRRITIGRYPDLSLAEARNQAKRLLAQQRVEPSTITFEAALTLFLETHCAHRHRERTASEHKRLLTKHLLPSLRNKRVADITTHHISAVLDRLTATPSEANHVFKSARTFFRWAIRRAFIQISPLQAAQMPRRETARSRVLSEAEIRSVWSAAETQGYPHGTIVQLLILTGQRRGEIGALRWEHIAEKEHAIIFPAALTKNGREHRIPYGALVARLLEYIPGEFDLLFPARGKPKKPFNGWSKSKASLDRISGVNGWTLHDLRRTFATNLAALGVAPHVTERLLNHVSGTISGVAAIYNRHAYIEEMREAIRRWEERLEGLLRT